MPITFNCSCGKRLQVKDEIAGRRVKCPACTSVVTVPTPPAEPQFEVVEDDEPAPAPAKAAAKKADTAGFNFSSSSEEKPRAKGRFKLDEDEEEEDDRPRSRRRRRDDDDDDDDEDEDDDEEDRPRRRRSRRAAPSSNLGKRIGYMIGGLVLVLIGAGLAAIGWFGEGRGATKMLILGVCFAIGGIGTGIKGLLGYVDDDEE